MSENGQHDGAVRPAAGGPLAGLRVVSVAFQLPGPYATLLLADLGADVVVVEPPAGGDPTRQFPGFFESLNRNKRSVALDLKTTAGHDVFMRLVESADVLLEGFRPGTMARLGLDYEALSAANPGLVYVSISGFGQDGPHRDRPAHDVSYQAMAGMLYERARSGEPGETPAVPVGDLSSGMFAVIGALSALHARQRTGRGAYVDLAMVDGLVSWLTPHLVPLMNETGPPGFPYDAGLGIYRCADGRLVSLSVAHEDWFWVPLCDVLGLGDVAGLTAPERLARKEELAARLASSIGAWSSDDLESVFLSAGVPFGPVLDLDEVAASEQVTARRLVVDLPATDTTAARRHVRQPLHMEGCEDAVTRHSPALGAHTREVLREVGLSPAEVDALVAAGVARDGSPNGAPTPLPSEAPAVGAPS